MRYSQVVDALDPLLLIYLLLILRERVAAN